MACGRNAPDMIQSWIDWEKTTPKNPLDLIANAAFSGPIAGTYANSSTYNNAGGGSWATAIESFPFSGDPVCVTLATDKQEMVANAEQWNFDHVTRDTASTLPPTLHDVVFLRGGVLWEMQIPMDFGANTYDLELSYLENAGTRGDYAETVPVITFSGVTGAVTLNLTLQQFGRASMGLRADDGGGTVHMYESEWIVVP